TLSLARSSLSHDSAVSNPSPEILSSADYLALVGHELRSPLTVIKGCAGTLLNPALSRDDERRASYARRIARAADQMARLIDGLVTAARVETAEFLPSLRPMNLSELTQNAIRRARDCDDSRGIRVSVPRTPIFLDGDPDLLERVIDNLLSNAAKY